MLSPTRTSRVRRRALRTASAATAGTLVLAGFLTLGQSASQAADSRPTISFSNSGTQSTIGNAYTKALTNLLDTNTVTYDPNTYNKSGLMTTNPQKFIRAGGGYPQPWTRDGAVNPWNAGSLLEPTVAANTLWSNVVKQSNGQYIVVQDNQWWDQVIWLTGAWNQYLVTGDRTFLTNAYQAGVNTLNIRQDKFNSTYGLYKGPSFFNDGISGYPAPPADSTESHGGFVLDYSDTSNIMALSTNSLYYQAFRVAAQMAQELGKPSSEVSAFTTKADNLKSKINQYLWNSSRNSYGYFLQPNGTLDNTEEGTGLSFAIMFGIASSSQAASILGNTHVQPFGIVDTYPAFARYNATDHPGRHNVSVWPVVQGYWGDAAALSGNQSRFASELTTLAGLANNNNGFFEIYNAQSGVPDGGWQGGHWGPLADQTWSATAYLRMVYNDLFGVKLTTGGITFQPTLPSGFGDMTLSGLNYRNATLTIALHGSGNQISSFKLDGNTTGASIPNNLSGNHTVDITLTGGSTSGPLKSTQSGRCIDVPGASTTNGTAINLWDCNGGGNQNWTYTSGKLLQVYGNKCLDVTGGSTADGAAVIIWDCHGGTNQQWTLNADGSIVGVQSGKCLDQNGFNGVNGTKITLWSCNGGANQKWLRN